MSNEANTLARRLRQSAPSGRFGRLADRAATLLEQAQAATTAAQRDQRQAEAELRRLRHRLAYFENALCLPDNPLTPMANGEPGKAIAPVRIADLLRELEELKSGRLPTNSLEIPAATKRLEIHLHNESLVVHPLRGRDCRWAAMWQPNMTQLHLGELRPMQHHHAYLFRGESLRGVVDQALIAWRQSQ